MTHTRAETQHITALIAALNARQKAAVVDDGDRPFSKHRLDDLVGGLGILKAADHIPALNMAAQAPDEPAAYALEEGRFLARQQGKKDHSARRAARARQRDQRRQEFDRLAEAKAKPPKARLDAAWLVVFQLVGIVTKIAKGKQRWANRLLGGTVDDIPQVAMEQMALMLARQSKWDLNLLRVAAHQLASSEQGIPGDQKVEPTDDNEERKQLKQARKWLMGMVNNRVKGALADAYTDERHLRWDNLDMIATVMEAINGVGEDPTYGRFRADRAPALLGAKFQRPDGINADMLAMAISAAITDRGLDPLVELLLESTRVDGAVQWTANAETIFRLTPGGYGDYLWDQVLLATAHHARAQNARGEAAMRHVRNQFAWMPSFIVSVVDAFNPEAVTRTHWRSGKTSAVMASQFELFYLPDSTTKRYPLRPALRFGSVEEAVHALVEHLAVDTGSDYITSLIHD